MPWIRWIQTFTLNLTAYMMRYWILNTPFEDELEKVAKREAKRRAGTIDFWFRRKYNLTANDPRFLHTTELERVTDYWTHRYFDDPRLMDMVEDEDFDIDAIMAEWADGDVADVVTDDQLNDPEGWEEL